MEIISKLAAEWIAAKHEETAALERRRNIEDQLSKLISIPDTLEGTQTEKSGEFVIKIVGRIDRKVDSDEVQDLANEHGLNNQLGLLFRWKPELNMKAWKNADKDITEKLLPAITSKPGRPSFSITDSTMIKED